MTKSIVIVLFIILAVLLGFTYKNDFKSIRTSSLQDSLTLSDTKYSFPALEETYPDLDYESVIDKYSPVLEEDFFITKFRHFVIFSNLSEQQTYLIIDEEIRNASDAMINSYTSKTPDSVTALFLFEDYDSYKEFTMKNTNIKENNLSQYGYYKISMNLIAIRYLSWKGSPKHEVTHRYIRSDFPRAASWFDEGMASLNEKSIYINGTLRGEFSLRIIAIRRAIKENRYTGIKFLMQTGDDEFYGKYTSFYYAQARYLLMYLQEKGLLEKYYRLYRDTHSEDKTGIKQLEEILGKSIDKIDKDYYEYITSFKD
jgi:hypothetical protein